MLYMGYLIILDRHSIKKISFRNSIAFGKSTSHLPRATHTQNWVETT